MVQTEEHGFDCGRAAQNMMLAAWNEGIGSCPAHLPEAELAKLLGIPATLVDQPRHRVRLRRSRGGGGAPASVSRRRLPLAELVHWEAW